jgi:hypothetical protein
VTGSVTCEFYDVFPDEGLKMMDIYYGSFGVDAISFEKNNGSGRVFGVKSKLLSSRAAFTFKTDNQLVGFWGREEFGITELGIITRGIEDCF